MESHFSLLNNTKYWVLSYTLINPSILSSLICKGLESIKVLYEML